jgi:hypothetical protein
MTLHKLIVAFALAAVAALFALPATAQTPYGSRAWANHDATLYAGPGRGYDPVGDIAGDSRIRVDRCQKLWCEVHAGRAHGWMSITNVSFGNAPHPFWVIPGVKVAFGGPGSVCFYDGANYTGRAECVGPGHSVRDLLLTHRDNAISSIRIEGRVTTTVCRDRFFHSYCNVISTSQRHLGGLLNNSISSWQVY